MIRQETFAGRAASELSAGGWLDPDSESQAVAVRLADDFGAGKGTLVLVYSGPGGSDAKGDAFQSAIAGSVHGLEKLPVVDAIVGYAQTGDARFISTDGGSAYVVVQLNVSDEASVEREARLRELYDAVLKRLDLDVPPKAIQPIIDHFVAMVLAEWDAEFARAAPNPSGAATPNEA